MSILDLFRRGNRVDPETYRLRIATCKLCPEHRSGVCTVCGCVTKLKAKVKTEECPRGKWDD